MELFTFVRWNVDMATAIVVRIVAAAACHNAVDV